MAAGFDDIIRVYLDFSSNASGVLDGVTSRVDSVGERITKAGQGFLPFSLGAATALGGAAKLAIDFDKAMQAASRGLDLSEKEVTEFGNSMEKLQAELKYQFSSTELANIATEAGKLGVAKNDIDDFAEVVTKLAVAVDKTNKIEELSTNVAKIQTIFNLSVPELEKFGAAMNALDDASSATADQISTFVQMAGKVGAAFKVNQNVLSAYGVTLISAGAKAGEAATFMNKFLTVLAAPTNSSKPAQEAIEKLGYSVSDLGKRFDRDAKGTMEDFLTRLNKLDNVTKRDVMGRIFGLEHIDNAALLSAQVDNLGKYLGIASNSSANLAKLNREFDKMASNSFEGQYRTFINMTGEFGKQIGLVLLPGLNDILRTVQPLLKTMVDFVQMYPGISKYIAFAGLAVAVLAPLTMTVGAVVTGVTSLVGIIGAAIPVLGSLGTIVGILTTTFLPVLASGFVAVGSGVLAALATFAPFIAAGFVIGGLAAIIIKNWTPIEGFFKNTFRSATNYLIYFANGYRQVFTTLFSYINSLITSHAANLQYYVTGYSVVFNTLKNMIGASFTNIIANAKYYGQMMIYNFIQGIRSYASDLLGTVSWLMQSVRNYLPSSPARVGALSDLDKTGYAFTDTFLKGVQNSGLDSFLTNAFTNPDTKITPQLAIPGAGGGGNNTSIRLEYSPEITGSRLDAQTILDLLRTDQRGLQRLLEDAVSKIDRKYYT